MKSNQALLVTQNSLGLIISNAKNKIAQKKLIQKKLTPFLFHHLTANDLTKNLEGMVKKEEKKSIIVKSINQEPNKINKDNFNPKDIKLLNQKALYQKYSTIKTKNSKTPRKRFYSALHTTRQKAKDKDLFQKRPSTSTNRRVSNQQYLLLSSRQKSTNTDTNVESNKIRFQKVFINHQIQSHTFSSKRFNKKQNQCVKLDEKDFQGSQTYLESFSQQLRQQKIKRQIEKKNYLQEEAIKNQRIYKLKEKFNQTFQNGGDVSFDFDGSIFNLKHQEKLTEIKGKSQNIGLKFTLDSKIKTPNVNKKNKKQNKKQKDQQTLMETQNPLIIQTQFKIIQDSFVQPKQIQNFSQNHKQLDQSTIKIFQSENNSLKNSMKNNQSSKITNRLNKNDMAFQNDKHEKNLTQKNYSSRRVTQKSSSFFSRNQEEIKRNNIKQNQINEYVQNQIDFTNNYHRQTSIIPYLDIKEGICYKQQMDIKPEKDQPFIQYATISKQTSLDNKDSNKTLTGHRTFRSYLSFKKSQAKPLQSFNQTFTTFKDKNKSPKSARIHFNLKLPHQQSSKKQNSVIIYSARNPLIEDLDNQTEKVKEKQKDLSIIRPKTTNNFFGSNQNQFGKTLDLKGFKIINKNQNILDLKSKLIMKQKVQKNFLQVSEIK